jgi:hypothetical protein
MSVDGADLDEDFETGRVSREFEEPHDPNDGEELENVGILDVGSICL